jgi:hypothetical protein
MPSAGGTHGGVSREVCAGAVPVVKWKDMKTYQVVITVDNLAEAKKIADDLHSAYGQESYSLPQGLPGPITIRCYEHDPRINETYLTKVIKVRDPFE